MKSRSHSMVWWSAMALACGGSAIGRAELKTFAIDQAQSVLTLSGTFSGFAVQQQGPGSLTTHYTGTIETDLSDAGIVFVGGSQIIGVTNGNWQPGPGGVAGTAPANYGGQVVNLAVNGKAAVRDIQLDLTSGSLTVSNEMFSSQELEFAFPPTTTTVFDYSYSITLGGSGSGRQPFVGTLTNTVNTNATLGPQGAELVLTIPVDIAGAATVQNPNDLQYQLRGRLVARAAASLPLRISSFQSSSGRLDFTIATTPGQSFTILASTNLTDWPVTIDQFTATNNPSVRTVALPASLPQQFFRVRQD
jgi:hypothetical protein